MDKLALGFFKWLILPAAIGAFGYFVIGPRIGRSENETAVAKTSQESSETVDAATSVDSAPAEAAPTPTVTPEKPAAKPAKTPPADVTVPSKFDPAVPQGAQEPSGQVDVAPVPTEGVSVTPAKPDEAKAAPRRRRPATKKPANQDEGGTEGATPAKRSNNSDYGAGDDVRNVKSKPKSKPEKKPDLPSTPQEPKDPGNGGGGEEGSGG